MGSGKIWDGTQWVYIGPGGGGGPHAPTHEDGGGDEVNVAGLSGELADEQDAGKLKGKPLDDTGLADDKIWVYDSVSGTWKLEDKPAGGGAPTDGTYLTTEPEAGLSAEKVLGADVILRGLAAQRPAARVAGRYYIETDSPFKVWRDTGAEWVWIGTLSDGPSVGTFIAQRTHYDVKKFGAVGDNVHDDTENIKAAIQAASQDGGGPVYLPPLGVGAMDRYKVTGEELWLLEGVSLVGGHAMASRISKHGSDDAISPIIAIHDAVAEPKGFFIRDLTLGFEDLYNNVAAKCINFSVAHPQPCEFIIENVNLRNGYYGLYDNTGSFQAIIHRVRAEGCRYGFYKTGGGTGYHYDSCYSRGTHDPAWDIQAFYLGGDTVSVFLDNCAMDNWHVSGQHLIHFANLVGLSIGGLGIESCEQQSDAHEVLRFDNCFQVHAAGIVNVGVTITPGGGDSYYMMLDNSKVHFSGCRLDTVTQSGAGTSYTVRMEDSKVAFTCSDIVLPTDGTGAITIPGAAGTAKLILDACYLSGAINNPNENEVFNRGTY